MANQATAIRSQFDRGISALVVGVADALATLLVAKNPVKTGHSRNNWLETIGSRSGSVDGDRLSPSNVMQEASLSLLDHYDHRMGAVNVENNVDYMAALMRGSSSQAADGWVQDAINTVVEHADVIHRQVARVYWGQS